MREKRKIDRKKEREIGQDWDKRKEREWVGYDNL